MISKREATKKAAKYQVPNGNKEFVKLPSVEVLCAYIEMNNLEVVGWRGDLLVVRKRANELVIADEKPEHVTEMHS